MFKGQGQTTVLSPLCCPLNIFWPLHLINTKLGAGVVLNELQFPLSWPDFKIRLLNFTCSKCLFFIMFFNWWMEYLLKLNDKDVLIFVDPLDILWWNFAPPIFQTTGPHSVLNSQSFVMYISVSFKTLIDLKETTSFHSKVYIYIWVYFNCFLSRAISLEFKIGVLCMKSKWWTKGVSKWVACYLKIHKILKWWWKGLEYWAAMLCRWDKFVCCIMYQTL